MAYYLIQNRTSSLSKKKKKKELPHENMHEKGFDKGYLHRADKLVYSSVSIIRCTIFVVSYHLCMLNLLMYVESNRDYSSHVNK